MTLGDEASSKDFGLLAMKPTVDLAFPFLGSFMGIQIPDCTVSIGLPIKTLDQ